MAGKLTLAPAKNQLWRGTRSPRAHERPLALHSGEHLLPGVIPHVLERHRQWLIEVDGFVEQIDRALRLALLQPLLTEPGAERQHLQSPEIASTARNHQLHWTEVDIRLDAVKRHVPEVRRPATSAARHRGNRLL